MAMMHTLHIQCPRCGASTITSDGSDPDGQLACGCCTEDHHHGQAAMACPGVRDPDHHAGAPCHADDGGRACVVHTEEGEECPGGHCGPGVDGCTVCRPLTITVLAAAVAGAVG